MLDILTEILQIPDMLMVVKSGPVVAEIRSHNMSISQRKEWVTIGDNDDPAHMHINTSSIKRVNFVREEKSGRTSFSVQFADDDNQRVLAAFFTKMYDHNKNVIESRVELFDLLEKRWGSRFKNCY